MYTDVVLLVVLIALIYYTPPVVASFSTTLLGKLLLTWCTLLLAVYRGRNAGVMSAFITVLLLYRGRKEGFQQKDVDIECENDDCPKKVIKEAIEGEEGEEGDEDEGDDTQKAPTTSESSTLKTTEGFLSAANDSCGIFSSCRLSLGEALRSINSNKLPVSSTRGNGGTDCPQGCICPQSAESVKSGFFS